MTLGFPIVYGEMFAYKNGYEAGKKYAAEKFAELLKKELITLYLSKRCDEICAGIINDEEHI